MRLLSKCIYIAGYGANIFCKSAQYQHSLGEETKLEWLFVRTQTAEFKNKV